MIMQLSIVHTLTRELRGIQEITNFHLYFAQAHNRKSEYIFVCCAEVEVFIYIYIYVSQLIQRREFN